MEKVKFGTALYDLVVNGVQLGDQGGRIILRLGTSTFDAVKADVRASNTITVLDETGEPILTRSDLVYAGRLTQDDNYIITDQNGEDGAVTVLVVEFRVPDLREQYTALEAKMEYVAMMAGIEMEV